MRCCEGALDEPLAGTAPRARWWWLIEVPGPWGRDAVTACRVEAVRALTSDAHRRVLLVRRPGRQPAYDPAAPLRVWIAGGLPGDAAPRLALAAAPEIMRTWPADGPDDARPDPSGPVLAVCANSARDLCCGLEGRALAKDLAAEGVWECSHLGGHRFAPTALFIPEGRVYGRLNIDVARTLLIEGSSATSATFLRGRSGLPEAAQAAEAHLMRLGYRVDTPEMRLDEFGDGHARVEFAGLPPVDLRRITGAARPASCGAEPEPWARWQASLVG